MFGKQNLYCTVQSFKGIRIKDERQNDRNLLVEFGFETPLTADLADEIRPKWVGEFFDEGPDGFTPKPDFKVVQTNLAPGRQVVTLRLNPDLEAFASVEGVTIKAVTIKKAAKLEQWVLSWTMTFPLQDDLMMGLIRSIRTGVHMTCVLMDPKLFPEDDANPDADGDGDATDGQAEAAAPKRGRGRPKGSKTGTGKRGRKAKEVDQPLPVGDVIDVEPVRDSLPAAGGQDDTGDDAPAERGSF
jgi:hypothetical protein